MVELHHTLEIVIVMIIITILSAITMVEIAVDKMLTQIIAANVYVWMMLQHKRLQQVVRPQVQLTPLLQH